MISSPLPRPARVRVTIRASCSRSQLWSIFIPLQKRSSSKRPGFSFMLVSIYIIILDADKHRLRRERSIERLSGYTQKNYQGKSAKICVLFNDAVQNFLPLFRGKLLSVKMKEYFLLYSNFQLFHSNLQ